MIRWVLTWLFLAAPVALGGHVPGDCGARLTALSKTFDAALLRTRAEYGANAKNVEISPATIPSDSSYEHRLVARVTSPSGEVREVGKLDYIIENGVLSLNVDVGPDDRSVGLNKLLLLSALKSHPEVRHLQYELFDTNTAAFVVNLALFAGRETDRTLVEKASNNPGYQQLVFDSLREDIRALKSGAAALAYRNNMLEAYRSGTPAGRTAQAGGFNKISNLVLMPRGPNDIGVSIDVEVASARDDDQARVFIELEPGSWIEILPTGKLVKTKGARPK